MTDPRRGRPPRDMASVLDRALQRIEARYQFRSPPKRKSAKPTHRSTALSFARVTAEPPPLAGLSRRCHACQQRTTESPCNWRGAVP